MPIFEMTVYDWMHNIDHKITVMRINGRYRVNVDGQFWATCENRAEASDEVDDLIDSNGWKLVMNI